MNFTIWSGILSLMYGYAIYFFGQKCAPIEIAALIAFVPMIAWLVLFYVGLIEEQKTS